MTSLAFIFGVVPLVWAGTAVFAGMIGAMAFGLIFTPVFYVICRGLAAWRYAKRAGTGSVVAGRVVWPISQLPGHSQCGMVAIEQTDDALREQSVHGRDLANMSGAKHSVCRGLRLRATPRATAVRVMLSMVRSLAVATILFAATASAQSPPSPVDLAAYTGLHHAAARGGVTEIRTLLGARADPNVRDMEGRTPLHVAAFESNYDAVGALVAGGGDINALENAHV